VTKVYDSPCITYIGETENRIQKF